MSQFFDKFPVVPYNINRNIDRSANFDLPVNIMVRVRVLTEKLNQVFHYYEYTVKDGDSPEILADKVYGSSEAHWLILLTNNRTDPQFDWPLGYDAFNQYIIDKYGSLETAQTTYHHFNKIVKHIDDVTGIVTKNTYRIQTNPISEINILNAGRGYSNGYLSFSNNYGHGANASFTVNANGSIISLNVSANGEYIGSPNVTALGSNTSMAAFNTYVATANTWIELPTDEGGYTSYTPANGAVNLYQDFREEITNYDWEVEQNDNKRRIKLIKPEYYSTIRHEFLEIMSSAGGQQFNRRSP